MCTKESKMNYKFDGSKVYFTSDTHFYHSNIIGFCKRLFKNVEDMNETLIENWNQVVSQDDIVFHLGDFCMGSSHAKIPQMKHDIIWGIFAWEDPMNGPRFLTD